MSRVKHYINNGAAFSYSYDDNGNISSIQNPDGSWVEYEYDDLNQLVSEQYSTTQPLASLIEGGGTANAVTEGVPYNTISYSYDARGNILSKNYSLDNTVVDTITYTYTDTVWADRLTAFDGVAISYDEIGNPLNWRDGASLSWQHGRQLAGYATTDKTISYTYNADGIRTSKTVNGVKTIYNVIDGTLRRMTSGENTLEFINGTSVLFNGVEYWYVFNAQNDVIGIIDASGNYVVEYTYDAWGAPLSKSGSMSDTLGTLNPFRYRGYIYDDETGWYYCQSRYYDPAVGRFINADSEISGIGGDLQGYNLYAYCANNPINRVDNSGQWWDWIGALCNVVAGTLQMVAGATILATVGWTGIGGVAGTALLVNGAATTTQGVGQLVNKATGTKVMREDNIVRTAITEVGRAIGGDTGADVAGAVYDTAITAALLYEPFISTVHTLQQAGKIPVKVNIDDLIPDPTNPMTDEGINYWTRTLAQNGFKGYNTLPNAYGAIEPICVQKGTMMIANGHHRVAVLKKYGVETIKVYLVP